MMQKRLEDSDAGVKIFIMIHQISNNADVWLIVGRPVVYANLLQFTGRVCQTTRPFRSRIRYSVRKLAVRTSIRLLFF